MWSGRHATEDIPVAVKVITGHRARLRRFREDFEREVRSLARLEHPNITWIHEYGVIDSRAERASDGHLVADSPYLVMEHVGGGSLHRHLGRMAWNDVLDITRAVLSALAHAHARGVIHRDIKPGNVLLAGPEDLRPATKLADFGIAHAADAHTRSRDDAPSPATREEPAGTPWYMAPEQFAGRWREYGPWTDLYALGILLWELTTGSLPFRGDAFVEVAMQHMEAPLPAYHPVCSVPSGWEGWLRALLDKQPMARFRRAADALAALDQVLEDGGVRHDTVVDMAVQGHPGLGSPRPVSIDPDPTVRSAPSISSSGPLGASAHAPTLPPRDHGTLPEQGPATAGQIRATSVRPPFRDWRDLSAASSAGILRGCGLQLLGMRQLGTVDRFAERDRLWAMLGEVTHLRSPRVAVVSGPVGTGKSHLTRWLTETGMQGGYLTGLRAAHLQAQSAGRPMARMLAEHLRCVGLDELRAHRQIERRLGAQGTPNPNEVRALVAYLREGGELSAGEGEEVPTAWQFSGPDERYALLYRTLHRAMRERPVLLVLEDCEHAPETIDLAGRLVEDALPGDFPLAIVLTVGSEAVASDRDLAAAIGSLVGRVDALRLDLGPLPEPDLRELFSGSLGLDGRVVDQLVDRTAGNPLFAVQLVGDLVQRELLRFAGGRFQLRPGTTLTLPENLFELARARLEDIVQLFGNQGLQWLELAATLGDHVRFGEWLRIACMDSPPGSDPEAALRAIVDWLLRSRLAETRQEGWVFSHAIFRESLLGNARRERRLVRHHECCLRLFDGRIDSPVLQERKGRHEQGAGRLDAAVISLVEAADGFTTRRQLDNAHRLVFESEGILNSLGAPDDDIRRLPGWIILSHIHMARWEMKPALQWAQRAERRARAAGRLELAFEAAFVAVSTQRHLGPVPGEIDRVLALVREAAEHGSEDDELNALRRTISLLRERDRIEEAMALIPRAEELVERASPYREAQVQYTLGILFSEIGDIDRAERAYVRSRELYLSLGLRYQDVMVLASLANLQRERGNLKRCERMLREVVTAQEELFVKGSVVPRFNLVYTLCLLERFDDATSLAEETMSMLHQGFSTRVRTVCETFRIFALAGSGDIPAVRKGIGAIEGLLGDSGVVHREAAEALSRASEHLERHREYRLALRTLILAEEQWSCLDEAAEMDDCRARRTRLEARAHASDGPS